MNILIDFDGTVVFSTPEPGFIEDDTGAEFVIKHLVNSGHNIILWTCRNNSNNNPFNYFARKYTGKTSLGIAESWFEDRGISLAGVNEVPGEENIVGYARKALGDLIIDDTSIGIPLIKKQGWYFSWITGKMEPSENLICVDWKKIYDYLVEQRIIKL